MTIDEIYRSVRVIANKEQRGFLKPSEFNLLADQAQMELFTQRYNNVKEYQSVKTKAGSYTLSPGVVYSTNQKVVDDLRPFINYRTALAYANGFWAYPAGYLHALSMTCNGAEVEFVGEDRIVKRLNSSIVPPNAEHPIAIQADGGFVIYASSPGLGDVMSDLTTGVIQLTFLDRPTRPFWAFTEVSGNPIYNPTNSVDFQFEEQAHNELINKILNYIGIHIREKDLYTYGVAKEQAGA